MKKIIYIILCNIFTISIYAQQWVLDDINDEKRGSSSSPANGFLGMLLLFGIIIILGYIADKWKETKAYSKNERTRIEKERKEKENQEKTEKVLRANAIPLPIDLGLSVKWANFNIGAYKPNDMGDYFYWAENCPSKRCYPLHSKKKTYLIGDISGKIEYDAATKSYGDKWRIPTDDECKELIDKCSWKPDTIDGVEGCTIIGPNGNSIFLPFTDKYSGDKKFTFGHYWSSSPSFRKEWSDSAKCINITNSSKIVEFNFAVSATRTLSSIRPVYGEIAVDNAYEPQDIEKISVDNLTELYNKFEEQSYIRDEEKRDIPIPGGILFDKTKTFIDECNVVYSIDGKRLLDASCCNVSSYYIKEGTEIICNNAFGRNFFQEINNRVELGKIIIPSSVCYIAPSALPNTCSAESHSPYYEIIDELLIDKRKLCIVKCLNKFKQKAFIGNPIVSIESYAFANCDALRQVYLPDSLVSIEEFAFYNCPMLQEVNLPNSLMVIENQAFGNCELLSIKSLPRDIRNIGNYAFFRCKYLEGTLPSRLESLGIAPFPKNNSYLKSLSSKYSVKNGLLINNSKHSIIQSLQKDKVFDIPESIVCIEDDAFSWSEIETFIIPQNIQSIGDSAFSSCLQLTHFEFNSSIKLISKHMFSWCKKLQEILLPDRIEEIGDYSFKYCTELNNIVLPKSLIVIGVQAFAECHMLESIIIPQNVERIGNPPQILRIHDAFYNCKNLNKVILNARHVDYFELPESVQIREIGEQVETIPSYFFSGYNSAKIEIPNNIKEIKPESFRGCKYLTEISFYCKDVEVQKNWLVNCENLKIIKIVKDGFNNISHKVPKIKGVKYKKIYKHNWGIIRW